MRALRPALVVGAPPGELPGPPVAVDRRSWFAVDPASGRFSRFASEGAALARAREMAERGAERRALVFRGAATLEGGGLGLLELREEVRKAPIDPLDPAGLARLVEAAKDGLLRPARAAARRVARELRDLFGVDFAALPAAAREEILGRAASLVRRIANDPSFRRAARRNLVGDMVETAEAARASAVPGVTPTLAQEDRSAVWRAARSKLTVISDEYGRRSEAFDREARRIVARGIREGVGRREIGRRLFEAFSEKVVGRDEPYYRMVASTAIVHARSLGVTTGLRDAGIGYYTWEAMLDERTCDICGMLHGQEFPVSTAVERMNAAREAATPEEAFAQFDFYAIRGDTIEVGSTGVPVARIVQSREGSRDFPGRFQMVGDPRVAGGTVLPPAHPNCRCVVLPVT